MRLVHVARVWAATYCLLSALVVRVATQEGVGYAEVMKGGATFYGEPNGFGTQGMGQPGIDYSDTSILI